MPIKKVIRFVRARWRWFAAITLLVVVAAAMYALSRQNPIVSALKAHHTRPGIGVSISILSSYPVPPSCPDSLRMEAAKRVFSRFSGIYMDLLRMGADATAAPYADSIANAKQTALQMAYSLENRFYPPATFTFCRYVVAYSGESAQYSDTLTAVVDNQRRVVWPD